MVTEKAEASARHLMASHGQTQMVGKKYGKLLTSWNYKSEWSDHLTLVPLFKVKTKATLKQSQSIQLTIPWLNLEGRNDIVKV